MAACPDCCSSWFVLEKWLQPENPCTDDNSSRRLTTCIDGTCMTPWWTAAVTAICFTSIWVNHQQLPAFPFPPLTQHSKPCAVAPLLDHPCARRQPGGCFAALSATHLEIPPGSCGRVWRSQHMVPCCVRGSPLGLCHLAPQQEHQALPPGRQCCHGCIREGLPPLCVVSRQLSGQAATSQSNHATARTSCDRLLQAVPYPVQGLT